MVFFVGKRYDTGFNGQAIDWNRINALAVKFVDAFKRAGDPLYVTKLLKLFFYFDFISFRENNKPFTGDVYFKLPYGPIPSLIKEQLDLLKEDNDENEELKDFELKSVFAEYLEAERDGKTKGYTLKVREDVKIPQKKFDAYFSEWDNQLFFAIVKEFKGKAVKEVVEITHQEAPYMKVRQDASIINYLFAFEDDFPKALPHYCDSRYSE